MAHSAHKTEEEYEEHFDAAEVLDQKITQLAEWVRESKHTVTFTGAGISTSAGIPDYRSGKDTVLKTGVGVWAARSQGVKMTKTNIKWLSVVPTKTHMAFIALRDAGMLKFTISQNVDGLHRRSGIPPGELADLHGNTNLEKCATCGYEYLRDYETRRAGNGCFQHETGRKCKRMVDGKECGGNLCDTIINFGENLQERNLKAGFYHAEQAELIICMGTSLRVSPANEMPRRVAQRRQKLVIINLQSTPLDNDAAMRINGMCDDVMVRLCEKLGVAIPEFQLRRFIRFQRDGDDTIVDSLDSDGTPASLFTRVTLEGADGEKQTGCLEPFRFKAAPTPKVLMEFRGHYGEPPLGMAVPPGDWAQRDFEVVFNLQTGEWGAPTPTEIVDTSGQALEETLSGVMLVPLPKPKPGTATEATGSAARGMSSGAPPPKRRRKELGLAPPHISGLWLGQAVPAEEFAREIAVNPIKWSLTMVRGQPQFQMFGAGYFDDAADIADSPIIFYTLRGEWDHDNATVKFKKLYSGAAADCGYSVDYEGALSIEGGCYVLKGTWKNEMGGSHGTFAARREP